MDLTFLVPVVLVVVAYLAVRQLAPSVFPRLLGQVDAGEAAAFLRDGAWIVDVRTDREFSRRHLPGAVHAALGRLSEEAPQLLPDRGRVLLLYCQSGGRSLMAQRILRGLGYEHVHNLGSYSRAQTILDRGRKR